MLLARVVLMVPCVLPCFLTLTQRVFGNHGIGIDRGVGAQLGGGTRRAPAPDAEPLEVGGRVLSRGA